MIQKVQPGQKIRGNFSAAAFNAMAEAADAYSRSQHDVLAGARGSYRDSGTIFIKNASGSDRERFDVLAFDQPLFLPSDAPDQFANQVVMTGVRPWLGCPPGSFGVLVEPIADGAIGRAQISGVTPAKVYVNNEADTHADLRSQWNLTTSASFQLTTTWGQGARILWKEAGTGLKLAVVQLGQACPFWTAIVLDGRTVGMADAYFYAPDIGTDAPLGWYVEELPLNLAGPGTHATRSRTRDANGAYIPTVLYTGFAFWPAPFGRQCMVPLHRAILPAAVPYNAQIIHTYTIEGKRTDISGAQREISSAYCYSTSPVKWHYYNRVDNYEVPGQDVLIVGPTGYPEPTVGEITEIAPITGIAYNQAYEWRDLTPRIAVSKGTPGTGSIQVKYDPAWGLFVTQTPGY